MGHRATPAKKGRIKGRQIIWRPLTKLLLPTALQKQMLSDQQAVTPATALLLRLPIQPQKQGGFPHYGSFSPSEEPQSQECTHNTKIHLDQAPSHKRQVDSQNSNFPAHQVGPTRTQWEPPSHPISEQSHGTATLMYSGVLNVRARLKVGLSKNTPLYHTARQLNGPSCCQVEE